MKWRLVSRILRFSTVSGYFMRQLLSAVSNFYCASPPRVEHLSKLMNKEKNFNRQNQDEKNARLDLDLSTFHSPRHSSFIRNK